MAARGSNFSIEEESQTCVSYLYVCKDPIVGTNQQSGTFWDKHAAHFNAAMPVGSEMRSARSLETKWRQIRADVSKFIGNMATARAMPKSGESAEDVIERAEQIYTAMKEKEAAAFKLHHCWRILEKEPKWL
eukprot:jgi/Phyca11/126418/e_gw1.63.141.1